MINFVNKERETFSGYHIKMGREWRLFGQVNKLHTPLAYSAFEFRIAIERFLFEFFYLIKKRKFCKHDEKQASSVSRLISAIYKEVGGKEILEKRLRFNRIVSEMQIVNGNYLSGRDLPSVFDIDILNKYWQKLSNYCHKQLKPEITWSSMGNDWVVNGYNLLNEAEDYLLRVTVNNSIGWFNMDNAQIEIINAFNDYCYEKINDDDLKLRIRLLNPTFEYRKRNKIK